MALKVQVDHLDRRCRDFIARCPFVLLGSTNTDGTADVSPKGGPPGFVKVLDDHHLALLDMPGNNRLDGLKNIIRTGSVGMLFIRPGLGGTIRVNGTGHVVRSNAVLDLWADAEEGRPTTAMVLRVHEAFPHCPRAFRRAGVWDPNCWPVSAASDWG
jgi:PPOX class probable FMN-dependent enzyme